MIRTIMSFGKKYEAWRKSKKMPNGKTLSNYFISKKTGVAPSNLTNMEKDIYHPSDEVLERLAAVPELEITFETLKLWQLEDKYGSDSPITKGAAEAIQEAKADEVIYKPLIKEIEQLPDNKLVEIMEKRFNLSKEVLWALIQAEQTRKNK